MLGVRILLCFVGLVFLVVGTRSIRSSFQTRTVRFKRLRHVYIVREADQPRLFRARLTADIVSLIIGLAGILYFIIRG